jgi:hypothetical protein
MVGEERETGRLAADLKEKRGQQGHHHESGLAQRRGDLRHGAILDEAGRKVKAETGFPPTGNLS